MASVIRDTGKPLRRCPAAEERGGGSEAGLATSAERELRRWQTIVARVLNDVRDPGACFAERYEHFARPTSWRVEPGTAQLLTRIRDAGYALAIASNYDHRLHRVLAGIAALAFIETVVISSEVGWRKPAPAFFAHLANALRLPPNRVLYVGDDFANDFGGARQAGMSAMLFDPHARHPELARDRIGALTELRLPGV